MGMSTATSQLIFFIAAMVVASAVVGAMSKGVFEVTDGISGKSKLVDEQLKTSILIINDPDDVLNNPVVLYVKNTGSTILGKDLITVQLDGDANLSYTVSVTGGMAGEWSPSSLLTITITKNLASGDHSAIVTTQNGVSDSFKFTI